MPSRRRSARCSGSRRGCCPDGRRRRAGRPDRSMAMLLVWAAALTVLAGLFAMTDSALSRVSAARALEMSREGVRGAGALHAVAADLARHLNLLLLLRLLCELSATTLVAVYAVGAWGVHRLWLAGMVTAGSMTVVSFVAVGVAPRTIGRQHAYTVGCIQAPSDMTNRKAGVTRCGYCIVPARPESPSEAGRAEARATGVAPLLNANGRRRV